MDVVLALLVVGLAGLYVARRAWRTLRGDGVTGCGGSGPCPASTALAADLARAARGTGRGHGR